MKVTADMTVGEAIRRYPRTIRVFEIHRVVSCCTPERAIHEAAQRFDADEAALLRMLNAVAGRDGAARRCATGRHA